MRLLLALWSKVRCYCARAKFNILWDDYEFKIDQLEKLTQEIEIILDKVPHASEQLKIKGIGVVSLAGFFAEIGDLRRVESPKQIRKLAGFVIKENS